MGTFLYCRNIKGSELVSPPPTIWISSYFSESRCVTHLGDLKNAGKQTLKDLVILKITTVEELSRQDPTFLFQELERRTGHKQDPCVWDVFAAIIHQAKTGHATNWWKWTKKRKELQKEGTVSRS